MAVAAYTSLVSLSNLLDNVYDRIEIQFPRLEAEPFDALREGVNFLLSQIAAHSQLKSENLQRLWTVIVVVARRAEEIIDAHVVDQLYKESQEEDQTSMGHSTFYEDMEEVNQDIQVVKTGFLGAIQEKEDTKQREVKEDDTNKVSPSSHKEEDIVVGLDDKVIEIMDELASGEADLKIITITGMGGIGKTTLAKTVYGHPFIVEYFDVRLWVVVSQKYVVEQVLEGLIESGEKKFFSGLGGSGKSAGELLGEKLYKGLFGRRYLVVMDDVWSTRVWDELKRFFPKNGNGSRIMMTTRDSLVARSLSSISNINTMGFLDIDRSWELFCQKAFSQGDCPIPELEELGKNIAKGCKGLPLSITVIGSMLASSEMTREYWESVAEDVNSFRNLGDDGHCLEILSLSYNNLPVPIKACFLCMKYFDKDYKISVEILFARWITEDVIHPVQDRSLESVAEEYFTTLVHRNLILIHQYTASGDVRKCGLHDLVRDLCWREYYNEYDVQLMEPPVRSQLLTITREEEEACFTCGRAGGYKLEELNFPCLVLNPPSSSSSSQVSTFMCEPCAFTYKPIKRLSLVRVMENVGQDLCQEIVHATKMKDVFVKIPNDLMKFVRPSFFHLLWRLQVLIYASASDSANPIVLPSEVWKMPQLRQISVQKAVLTYPAVTDAAQKDFIILKYLHTLEHIRNFMCKPEVVCRIPNLNKLEIISDPDDLLVNCSLHYLVNLHKLEDLTLDKPILSSENISFPQSLKKLCLMNTLIPWKDIAIIGSLPNLEWVQLWNAFVGPDWDPTEGEFLRLKVLVIASTDLQNWGADQIHFPILEKLTLLHTDRMEIPSGIGDISALKLITLIQCGNNVINSAKQIWEEQQEYGNEMLQVRVIDEDGYYEFGNENEGKDKLVK